MARHGAKYVSLCRLDRLRATTMLPLATPYCVALPEQNSCQCAAVRQLRARQLLLRSTVDAQTTFEHTDGVMHGFHNYVWILHRTATVFCWTKTSRAKKKSVTQELALASVVPPAFRNRCLRSANTRVVFFASPQMRQRAGGIAARCVTESLLMETTR